MKFGHDTDPANDFCIEVEVLEGMHYDATVGMADMAVVKGRVARAMEFVVGGDPICVQAKAHLRALYGAKE